MGRPELKIDAEQVRNLSKAQWSVESIATHFKCDPQTIYNRFSGELNAGRQDLANLIWNKLLQRGIKDNSDRVLIHLAERVLGPIVRELKISEEPKFQNKEEAVQKLKEVLSRLEREVELKVIAPVESTEAIERPNQDTIPETVGP
jgi:hypothetical protein